MARFGSGESGAPGKPTKVVKRAAPKPKPVVRRSTPPPVTDVQSSGGDYGTRKAKTYQRTPGAQKPIKVATPELVRNINTGKTKRVIVQVQHSVHPAKDLLPGFADAHLPSLHALADYLVGNQYTGQKPGLADTIHHAEDTAGKGVVYVGETGRNIIRRLQGNHTDNISRAGFLPGTGPAAQAAQNLPVDFANTMVNAIPAASHVGSEIVHGKFGKAGKELAAPYVQFVKHPGQSLVEHPFSTAMLVAGPVRGVSRAGGALARRGAFGDAAQAAASTERAPAVVEGTKLVHPREYSPDPVGKAFQVLKEKGKIPGPFTKERRAVKLNRQADEMAAQGNHAAAAELRHRASLSSPTRMSEDQVKRRVDEIRDTNEVVRRRHATQVSQEVHAAVRNRDIVGGKVKKVKATAVKPTAAVSLVAQKIVHPTVEDLRTYQAELAHAHAHGDLTPSQRLANEQLRAQIQDALDHPQDMSLVQQAADRYRAVERRITGQLEQRRMIEPGEAAKRREMPFSARFVGGTRDAKVRLTQAGSDSLVMKERRAEQAQRVVRAEKAVGSTRQALDKAQLDVLRQKGPDAVLSEQRSLPRTTVAGRQASATGGQGVRDMLRWIDQVEKRDPTVVRSKIGKPVGQSPADRLRTAIATHENAQAVLDREKTAGRTLRVKAKQLRQDIKGKARKQAPGWVDAQGRPLTTAQMRAERERGSVDAATGQTIRPPLPGEPAYVSHAPNLLKPGSFYRDSGQAVSLPTKHFTGGSVTKGTLDASEHALHASARRLQSLLDAHEGHTAFLDETALRNQSGDVIRGDRARVEAAIERATVDRHGHPLPGARKWRIVRTNPFFGGRPGQLEQLMNTLNDHGELHSNEPGGVNPVVANLEDALRGKGDGPFVAVPEEAVVQLEKHLRLLGSQTGQVWNVISTLWRKNVLAFSPKWAASNLGEASERALVAGVRPGDRALLVKTVDAWMKEDPAQAERFLATIGQGHYGMTARTQRYATAQEFTDATRNGRFVRFAARLAGTVDRTPVANWLPKAYGEWTHTVMDQMGHVEGQFRQAMAGKKLRDLTQNSRLFADLSEKGVQQALEGLKGTPTQIQVARFTRDAFGQYEAFNPTWQAWIKNYTPFVAWARNAVKFLAVTLPRDHPVITALAADLTRSQEKWLRDLGLWMGQTDSLPAYLMGDVPTAGGGLLKVAKYTPQSLLGDPIGTASGLILPQAQNVLMAARGLDPFGKPLREPQSVAILKGLLGFVVPSPLVPSSSTGSSSILDRLNPVQVIPKSKVDYARVKATIDRVNNEISLMPQSAKTKRTNGTYPPKYAALLKQRSDLMNTRNVLLVKAGLKKDPAIDVEQQIRKLNVQAKAMLKKPDGVPGSATENGGYPTQAYAALRKQISGLEGQRRRLLKVKPPAGRVVKQRPKTQQEQIDARLQRRLDRLNNPDKAIQDKLNRRLERIQVQTGG